MSDRLFELLKKHSVQHKRVVLTSGKESDFFIDCKQTVLLGEGHVLVAEAMLRELARFQDVRAVAGVELGGCPLASAVACLATQRGQLVDAIYVRKQAKTHGSARLLEGSDHLVAGTRVAVLEDVVTTGGSTLRALAQLKDHGFQIAGVVAIVDREEGGADAIRSGGFLFSSLYTRRDFDLA